MADFICKITKEKGCCCRSKKKAKVGQLKLSKSEHTFGKNQILANRQHTYSGFVWAILAEGSKGFRFSL